MSKPHHQFFILILAAVFISACGSAPTLTSALTDSPPTDRPPTLAPTSVPPTPTALSPTATGLSPTTAPATVDVETNTNQDDKTILETNRMNVQIGDTVLTATLVDNSSVDALKETLSDGPISIDMRDYGSMEKVGSLGFDLPRNDEQITTEAGDIILYQGNAFVIYYAPNSWNFTRLGRIDNVTAEELKEILGDGSVTVTLSLGQE